MENPGFLKDKYNLHNSPEVESAAERTEARTGEKVPQNPAERIQNYLERFKEIIDRQDPEKRERGMEALKKILHDKFVIKPEDVPESAFLLEQRIARDLGHGTVEITEDFKEKKIAEIIGGQTQSLDKWVDYLSSPDAKSYPDWAKYWAFRSMLEMGKLQKKEDQDETAETKEPAADYQVNFQKRTKETVAQFPPLNQAALSLAIDAIQARLKEKSKPKAERAPLKNVSTKLNDQEFQALLSTESFSKLYAQFLIERPEYSTEGLREIRGKWEKYPKGSDATPLVKSLEGHPLEWCTAGFDVAQGQLQGGDFYVYYSLDQAGEPVIPRVAIRMEEERIAEIRGIAPNQNIDPYIAPVIQEKMKDKEFEGKGDAYQKKSADMKLLTAIENKTKKNQPLTKDDLVFLYEINAPIEGFGYQRDPRIEELREMRDLQEDMPIVLECKNEQIARDPSEITEKTKAYVGPIAETIISKKTGDRELKPEYRDIFQKIGHLEHIYTSFPNRRIRREILEIGGKNAEKLIGEMREKEIYIGENAEYAMKRRDFAESISETSESATFIHLTVGDLGFPKIKNPMTDEIYKRIKELGLELCPAETGPQYRLQNTSQSLGEWVRIGMKQITDSDGGPRVFYVASSDVGLWLNNYWPEPTFRWDPERKLLFRLRKKNLKT